MSLILGCGVRRGIFKNQYEDIGIAKRLGFRAVQIMTGDPTRVNKGKDIMSEDLAKKIGREYKDMKIFIHAGFLFNIGRSLDKNKFFAKIVLDDLKLASLCGAVGVVVHVARFSRKWGVVDPDVICSNITKQIVYILRKIPSSWGARLIVETGSDFKTEYPLQLEKLAECAFKNVMRSAQGRKEKEHFLEHLGFCIDTAHIYNAGYDVGDPLIMKGTLDLVDELFGENLVLVHFNDTSRKLREGGRDVHCAILEGGALTVGSIKVICGWAKERGVPLVLESHDKSKDREMHKREKGRIEMICVLGKDSVGKLVKCRSCYVVQ